MKMQSTLSRPRKQVTFPGYEIFKWFTATTGNIFNRIKKSAVQYSGICKSLILCRFLNCLVTKKLNRKDSLENKHHLHLRFITYLNRKLQRCKTHHVSIMNNLVLMEMQITKQVNKTLETRLEQNPKQELISSVSYFLRTIDFNRGVSNLTIVYPYVSNAAPG